MSVYMAIKIGNIKGESRKKGTEQWIEVKSVNHGMTQNITEANMAEKERAGFANFSFLTISKPVDISTPDIQAHCATGKKIDDVELKIYQASTDDKPLLAYKMENCFIAAAGIYGSEGGDPMEDISISYSKISIQSNAIKADKEMTKGFDLAQQVQV